MDNGNETSPKKVSRRDIMDSRGNEENKVALKENQRNSRSNDENQVAFNDRTGGLIRQFNPFFNGLFGQSSPNWDSPETSTSPNQIQSYDGGKGIATQPHITLNYNHNESTFMKSVGNKNVKVNTGNDDEEVKAKKRKTNRKAKPERENRKRADSEASQESEESESGEDEHIENGSILGRFFREIAGVMTKYADELDKGGSTHTAGKRSHQKKSHDIKDAFEKVRAAIMECDETEYKKWTKRLIRSAGKIHKGALESLGRGKEMLKQQNYIEAFISLRMVTKFHQENLLLGEMDVNLVQNAIGNIVEICRNIKMTLAKSTEIVQLIIVPEIRNMIKELQQFEVKDVVELDHNVAWCCKCLGAILMLYNNYPEAIQVFADGLDAMNKAFGTIANTKRIYGLIQSEIGECFMKQNKYEDALEYFKDADSSLKVSNDWGEDNRKAGVIDQNNRCLTEAEVKAKGSLELDSVVGILETAAENLKNKNYAEYEKHMTTGKEMVEQMASQQIGFQLKALGGLKYDEGEYFVAFAILNVTSKAFYLVERLTDMAVNCIQHAVGVMTEIIEKFCESQDDADFKRQISIGFIIPAMEDAIKDIEHLEGATMNDRIDHMAWCYKCMGSAFAHLKMNMDAVDAMKKGLELMERQFGFKADEHRIVGLLKGSIGNAYSMDKNHKEGTKWYKSAVESLQEAKDFSNDLEKEKLIRVSLHNRTASVLKANEINTQTVDEYSKLVNLAQMAVLDRDYAKFKENLDALSVRAMEAENPAAFLLNAGIEHDNAGDNLKSFMPFLAIANAYDEKKIDEDSLEIISNAIGRISIEKLNVPEDVLKNFVFVKIVEITKRLDFFRNTVIPSLKCSVVLCMTECYCHLSKMYEGTEMYKETIEVCKEAIMIMKTSFPAGGYKKYRVLCQVKVILGKAYDGMGNKQEAAKWFDAAQRALDSSTDWPKKKDKFEVSRLIERLRGVHGYQTNDTCNQQ